VRKTVFFLKLILIAALLGGGPAAFATGVDVAKCEEILLKTDSEAIRLDALPPEVRAAIARRAPFGQSMAVKIVDGNPVAYGTEIAVRNAKADIGQHKDIVVKLGAGEKKFVIEIDGETVTITTAPALSGSAVQSNDFGDIDIESVVSVNYRTFREPHLHQSNSIAARALAKFFQHYVSTVRSESGYFLTDFKSGEHDHVPAAAQKTHSRAVKWTEQEILEGRKIIETKSGKPRVITLEEALVSETRTKIDWAVDGPTNSSVEAATGVHKRMVDANVLFLLAGSRGNNSPVMRVAYEDHIPEVGATGGHVRMRGTGGFSPLRLTTVYFSPEHAELARQVSVATPPLSIFYTNAHLLDVTRTYRANGEYFKVLRRIGRRLNYWNDVPVFNHIMGTKLTASDMQIAIEEITESTEIRMLHQLRVMIEPMLILREKGQANQEAYIATVSAVRRYVDQHYPGALKEVPDTELPAQLERIVEDRVREAMKGKPYVWQYIDFVLSPQHSYRLQNIEGKPLFITFRPDAAFTKAYEKVLTKWRTKYPKIAFSNPSDLHMTVTFVGKVTPEVRETVSRLVAKYAELFEKGAFKLSDGSLQIIGSNNAQLGVVFDVRQISPEVASLIENLKLDLVRSGIRPDKHLSEFLPHISLAHVRDAYHDTDAHLELHSMLGRETLPKTLQRVKVSGELQLLEVNEAPKPQQDAPRYSNPEEAVAGSEGITVEDLDKP
jgi:2'-5' RNA ligase